VRTPGRHRAIIIAKRVQSLFPRAREHFSQSREFPNSLLAWRMKISQNNAENRLDSLAATTSLCPRPFKIF
jgi:hypothetical protein